VTAVGGGGGTRTAVGSEHMLKNMHSQAICVYAGQASKTHKKKKFQMASLSNLQPLSSCFVIYFLGSYLSYFVSVFLRLWPPPLAAGVDPVLGLRFATTTTQRAQGAGRRRREFVSPEARRVGR